MQERLGHTKMDTTMSIYASLIQKQGTEILKNKSAPKTLFWSELRT